MGWLRWFARPMPRFVCPLCLSTADESGLCGFCNSELCADSQREPLEEYLARHSLVQLEQQLADAKRREREAHGNRRFYARDYRRGVEALLRYKRQRS